MSSLLSILDVFEKFNEFVSVADVPGIGKIMPSGDDDYPFSASVNGDVIAFNPKEKRVDIRFTSVIVEKSMVLTTLVSEQFLMEIERKAKDFNHFVTFEQERGIIFTAVITMSIPLYHDALDDYTAFLRNSIVITNLLRNEIKEQIADLFRLRLN